MPSATRTPDLPAPNRNAQPSRAPDTRPVGAGAGELIAEVVVAMEMEAEVGELALAIHPHPSLSATIAMAAEVAEGLISDLYLPRK